MMQFTFHVLYTPCVLVFHIVYALVKITAHVCDDPRRRS